MTLVLTPVTAMLGFYVTLEFQMQQGPVIVISPKDHTTALAAVPTVRSAIGIIFDMLEVHRPTTALSRAAVDLHIVNEITLHYILSITF
jgi:hypothetical protein